MRLVPEPTDGTRTVIVHDGKGTVVMERPGNVWLMLRFARAIFWSTPASASATDYPWRDMPEKPKDPQETEQTPKGLTVPVPKRNEFFGNLKKIAKSQGPAPKPQQSGMRGKGSRRPPPHHNTRSK